MPGRNNDLLSRPILTDDDLHNHWTELMYPLGLTQCRPYLGFLDDQRRAAPVLNEISDVPVRATTEDARPPEPGL